MGIGTAIRSMAAAALSKHLPDRTKKLMFLASLGARLSKRTTFDQGTLHKLNKVMDLCSDDSALKLPVQISQAIWKGDKGVEVLRPDQNIAEMSEEQLEKAVDQLMKASPVWLRYSTTDSPDEIRQDIKTLLLNREILIGG